MKILWGVVKTTGLRESFGSVPSERERHNQEKKIQRRREARRERREATHTSGLDWDWKEGVKQSFQTAETLERAGKALLINP